MIRGIVVLLMLALCACDSTQTQPQQAEPAPPAATTQPLDFSLPFDHYRFSRAEQAVIQSALDRQTARCLERQGVPAPPPSRCRLRKSAAMRDDTA